MSIGGCGFTHVSVFGCVSSFGSEKVSKHLIKSDNPLNICIYKKGDVEPRRGRIWVWLTKDFNQNSQCRLNLISTIFYFFIASLFGSRFGFYSKHIYSGKIDNKSVNDSMKWLSLYLMWWCIGLVPQPTKSANKPNFFFWCKQNARNERYWIRAFYENLCVLFQLCLLVIDTGAQKKVHTSRINTKLGAFLWMRLNGFVFYEFGKRIDIVDV